MKKNLLFILFLVMPIALIGISIYNKDIERIERAFYFLLSICGAYIMSSLKEAKKYKKSVRGRKKIIILSFIGALFSIFVFFFLENIYLGCIIASMITIYPFSLIYKEQKC
jgi:fructose-specific phosphotransferase system IIC component